MKNLLLILLLALTAWQARAADPTIGETPEIIYTQVNAPDLYAQAQQLGSPLYIYQYLRNNTEFALYHGSISGSVNTYGGMRGNDVDLASTLIAMLRARSVPSRYVVGTIKVPSSQLTNWLGVQNATLAASLLNDVGMQGVTTNADGSVSFEHVWVEALASYDNYRGVRPEAAGNCSINTTGCQWIPLDLSFKQKEYSGENIDPYDAINFDYTAYYNAIKNNDQTRMNKDPLEILEKQIQDWLRTNHPGKTLEDVANTGTIIPDNSNLLPASLPYIVVGTPRRYNSVKDHDDQVPAVETKAWNKQLRLSLTHYDYDTGTGYTADVSPISLVDIATKRLVISYNSDLQEMEITVGGTVVVGLPTGNSALGTNVTPDTPYDLSISMDGPPSTVAGVADKPLTALYQNLRFGGYYLVTTGGETSNWSQVHRAAQSLLNTDAQYPIVFNPSESGCDLASGMSCTPFLDHNGNGWDATDPALSTQTTAMEALTGGLLYVAGSQYYVKQREALERLDHLMHTKTPVSGWVGVVSAVDTPEYIAGTAFSILPGGLLIDMKGDYFEGCWRIGQPAATSNKIFELAGHIGSSLEHEVWQELTGYDAVSTVRGIQMALANGATLLNPKKDAATNTLPAFYSALGFTSTYPNGFTYSPLTVFDTQPALWTGSADPAYLDLMKADVDYTTPLLRRYSVTYTYSNNYGIYAYVNCVSQWKQSLDSLVARGYGNIQITALNSGQPVYFCDSTPHTGTVNSVLSQLQTYYHSTIIPTYISKTYFDILDLKQGFVPSQYLYRAYPPATDAIDAGVAQVIRDTVSIEQDESGNPNGHQVDFLIPDRQTVGSTYRFTVYIYNDYDAQGAYSANGFSIYNTAYVAGGGYVDGQQPLNPASAAVVAQGQPSYTNAYFTDKNTISVTNNDPVRTVSTVDPVSTVTGNNYHDETDLTIRGRGLNVAFTRTYNSAPSAKALDRGLGFGWTHSYLMQLKSNDYGDCPNCSATQVPTNGNSQTSSITYTDERGGDHNYLVNDSTHAVTAPTGEFNQLVLNQGIATPGAALVSMAKHYTLVFRNGVRYEFANTTGCDLATAVNCAARLLHIDNPWGGMLTFGYDANGRLTTVSDNIGTGRTVLTLGYVAGTGRLASVTDLASRVWQYGYDADGNLSSVTNPQPATFTYRYYSGTHDLKDVVKPELRSGKEVATTFSYYRNGRAFNYHDSLGNTETLDYDLFRRSTRVTDPSGGVRSYEYDQNGALTKLTEPDGAILLFDNNPDGLRYSKMDGLGYQTQYSYNQTDRSFGTASDSHGNVTRERDAMSHDVDTTYGPYDQVASVKDKRGTTITTSFYSGTGSCAALNKPNTVTLSSLSGTANVKLKTYCWNSDGTLASLTEYLSPSDASKTRITSYTYDTTAHLNVQSQTVTGWDSATVTRSYTYDNLGRKKTETLLRRISPTNSTLESLTTRFDYDALDRVILVTDAVGNQTQTLYDKNGKPYRIIAKFKLPDASYENRTVVTRTYDVTDRLSTETNADGKTTTYGYDAAGNLVSATDANGHTTRYEYDAMNRRTATLDANGYKRQTIYDLAGHPETQINALGKQATTRYDALGRTTQITDALNHTTTLSYDVNGNLTCLTDADANAGLQPKNSHQCTLYAEYDELNRPTLEINAEEGQTSYAYDLLGNLTRLTDPMAHTWSFVYDGLGRQVGMTDPLSKSIATKVDEAGNVWKITDRLNQAANYTYDSLNRLTRVDYLTDNAWETYGYDYHGDLVSETNNAGIDYTYDYDVLHRRKNKTDVRTGQVLSYVYDPAANPIQKTAYTGDIINYQYDATNRLIAEQSHGFLQASYQYDGAGRLLTRTLSSGAQSIYTWDDGDRLASLTNTTANGTLVNQVSYNRDALGNILSLTDASGTTTYTYDPMYRLKTVNAPGSQWDEIYTYDKVGNRKTRVRGTATLAYDYDNANRLNAIYQNSLSGTMLTAYVWNDNGSLTKQCNGGTVTRTSTSCTGNTIKTYGWNEKNQLTWSLIPGKTTNTYQYDPEAYRVGKADSQGDRTYLLEGEHLEAVYQGTTLQAKFMRGSVIDEIINGYQRDTSGNWTNTTYHHDPLQSVVALSGHNGELYNATVFSAFGEIQSEGNQVLNTLKYTGREQDPDTGCYYYRARYYCPDIGRFISEDPKGFAAGINFYTYVGNDPVNANDPMGLKEFTNLLDAQKFASQTVFDLQQQNNHEYGNAIVGVQGTNRIIVTEPPYSEDPAKGYSPDKLLGFGSYVSKQLSGVENSYLISTDHSHPLFMENGNQVGFGPSATDIRSINNWAQTYPDVTGLVVAGNGSVLQYAPQAAMVYSNGILRDKFPEEFLVTHLLDVTPSLESSTFGSYGFDLGFDYGFDFASGGFVIYPNKVNNNQMKRVYAK